MSNARPDDAQALFVQDGDRYIPSRLTQGPWSPDLQFGGAAASLLATVVEELPTLVPQQVARLTIDLLRPVPTKPLTAARRIAREGKRIQLVEAALLADGLEVARCTALRFRLVDLGDLALPQGEARPRPPVPDGPLPHPFVGRQAPGVVDAAEFAVEHPSDQLFVAPTWIRMKVPVIAGRESSPLARMAFTADFASGIGHPRNVIGINADLSLNIVRYPTTEWMCFTGTGWTSMQGIGHSHALISDEAGVSAVIALSRLVDLADS
jgi:hypothetical protein